MNITSNLKNKRIFIAVMAGLLLVQLAVLFYYGGRKSGFHEDELYTYYSSNKTAGLFVNDRQWMEQDDLRNDFVVLPGEGFRYDVVWQMQSWDVHPPLYYYLFHTACSLVPGVFSKWFGIAVNLIAYVGSYLLLAYCAYTAADCKQNRTEEDKRKARILTFLTCFLWGFSAAVISGVMFVRMYQWLTLFVLLCLAFHLRAVSRQDFRVRTFLLPVACTVFLGFLTQYYYIIFHFFLGAGFCVYLLWKKWVKRLFSYAFSCALGLGAALLYYPPALSHIFKGYRGTEAVSEFGDASNTLERLRFFYGLFDDYVMSDTLSLWILTIALLAVTAGYLKKRGKQTGKLLTPSVVLMMFAAAGYFFTVSKTALLLGATSNRYQLPIYGIVIFLLVYFLWSYLERFTSFRQLPFVFLVVIILIDGAGLIRNRVIFLYEEERANMAYVKEHKDDTVIVFYNEASGDHIWWLSDELMEYGRVYLASLGNQEPISDGIITQSDKVLAYVADYEDQEECVRRLLAENENLSSFQVVTEKSEGMWTLYEIE
ncbi:MAG: hypothetical protein Q4D94_02645 [Bacillota bacterium]|nr:hypothetical protein [Bacillota bacterium]